MAVTPASVVGLNLTISGVARCLNYELDSRLEPVQKDAPRRCRNGSQVRRTKKIMNNWSDLQQTICDQSRNCRFLKCLYPGQ